MTHRKHLNAHGFPVHAPKAEKPTGANGYCGNEGGIVWCSILKERETFVKDDLSPGNHSTAIREFQIITYWAKSKKWSKTPRWTRFVVPTASYEEYRRREVAA